jgi:hypothetical protein
MCQLDYIIAYARHLENLGRRFEYLDHMIAYTSHEAKGKTHETWNGRRVVCSDLVCCRVTCEHVLYQRTVMRWLEEEKRNVLVSMAMQEICLNKSYTDFGTQDDVLRMIMEFATV